MFKFFWRSDKFTHSITSVIHCSVDNVLTKTTPLRNQSFFSHDWRRGSDNGRLAFAKSPKFHSPPDSDPGCSVTTLAIKSRVFLTALQQSFLITIMERCPAGRWRIRRRQNECPAADASTAFLDHTTHWFCGHSQ